ncbi:molybdopterin biosynthesis protein MoeB [Cohnella xylanilytica]|uniref:ThiF family adenylyltransferase n=1 Tax=Cohnella xylanilytica TaxID=557555 RepID=A0A841U1F4_9BACL|nr:ThiF family adenylyltransferase [Cohnella xylanilytica]MBB6691940.1 ThiF family adenylyltransferase [Cohnella xylanilytica]GIO14557.1 molybdopterin biosynthesis protein MoeB [Cohnella xylanilytica]
MTDIAPDQRYARQIRFAPIGREGQSKLGQARVAVVGAGALGCVIANHLARAGAGSLLLIDRDIVDFSNLQRQLLYDEADAASGAPKAFAAAKRLSAVNGSIGIEPRAVDLTSANAETLLAGVDLIVDGTDNFGVRYLINEVAVKHGIPWIYGAAVGASGMTMTIRPGVTPCLRCLFPSAPPGGSLDTCETAGVVAPIVDAIASIQAMEAIKLLSGHPEALHGSLLQVDLWNHHWQPLSVAGARRADCPVCAGRRFEALDSASSEPMAVSLCGRNTIQVAPAEPVGLDLDRLANRWNAQGVGQVERTPYLLRLRLPEPDGVVLAVFPDGRALVTGTEEPAVARRIYASFLGDS